jgi:hypothetical protein
MPIFDLRDGDLVPFRRQQISGGVFEAEIEDLLWDNLEELTGDNLFRVKRQAKLPSGAIPDIVALDPAGRVVVIEIKRDFDRGQLAQALEYAGWARRTNLDELAGMYHGGADAFWDDWREFTDTPVPVRVQTDPRLVLVARSFDGRTGAAIDFLLDHKLPVQKIAVAFYIDDTGTRFLDVEWESEPEGVSTPPQPGNDTTDAPVDEDSASYLEVSLLDVAGSVSTPADLVWVRPRKGHRYEATLLTEGVIRLADGREFRSPSGAAMAVADVVSYDGWYAWRLGDNGPTLNQLRHQIAAATTSPDSTDTEADGGSAPSEVS